MRAYALVTTESPEEAIELFLSQEQAEAAPADCLRDEPSWVDVLSLMSIELDESQVSAN